MTMGWHHGDVPKPSLFSTLPANKMSRARLLRRATESESSNAAWYKRTESRQWDAKQSNMREHQIPTTFPRKLRISTRGPRHTADEPIREQARFRQTA